VISDDDKVNLYNVARKRDQIIGVILVSLSIVQPLITGFAKIIIMPF
jgi:hypothetical protein